MKGISSGRVRSVGMKWLVDKTLNLNMPRADLRLNPARRR